MVPIRSPFPIISPQGDGNIEALISQGLVDRVCFSDHFPARGWKRSKFVTVMFLLLLFRSFPRKGMETTMGETMSAANATIPTSFPIISPQGDGNPTVLACHCGTRRQPFSDHFPARGWKHSAQSFVLTLPFSFPIISPQGDGNARLRKTNR